MGFFTAYVGIHWGFFFFWRGMSDFFHAAFSHLYWNSLWWVLEHRPRSWQLPSIWPDLLTAADEAQSKSLLSENGINLWTYLGSNYIQPHFFHSYPPTFESKLWFFLWKRSLRPKQISISSTQRNITQCKRAYEIVFLSILLYTK